MTSAAEPQIITREIFRDFEASGTVDDLIKAIRKAARKIPKSIRASATYSLEISPDGWCDEGDWVDDSKARLVIWSRGPETQREMWDRVYREQQLPPANRLLTIKDIHKMAVRFAIEA